MSKKATDLDGRKLSRGEKLSKTFTEDIPRWFYNKEKGTFLGERTGKAWGKILLYYLCFYAMLTIFFTICYSVMVASMPRRPDNLYFCTNDDRTNDRLRCHNGPRFKAHLLATLDKDAKSTDVLTTGLIDPTLSVFPSNLFIGRTRLDEKEITSTTSVSSYNAVSAQQLYNYGHLLLEARRAACDSSDKDVKEAIIQGQCDDTLINRVFPNNIPVPSDDYTVSPLEGSETQDVSYWLNLKKNTYGDAQKYTDDLDFIPPLPYVEEKALRPVGGENVIVNQYLMLFRLNKVWNYEPLDALESGSTKNNRAEIVNDIGVKCYFESERCNSGDKGINYLGETVECDTSDRKDPNNKESGTLSKNGALKIDMIADVMSTQKGFPWQGGAYDLSFGGFIVTWDKTKDIGTIGASTYKEAPKVRCDWGIAKEGVNGLGEVKNTVAVKNRIKNGYGGLDNDYFSGEFKIFQFN